MKISPLPMVLFLTKKLGSFHILHMKYLNYINGTWGDCLVQYNSKLHCKPARHHIFLGVGHCNSISV